MALIENLIKGLLFNFKGNKDLNDNQKQYNDRIILEDIAKNGTAGCDNQYHTNEKALYSVLKRYNLNPILNELSKQIDLARGGSEPEIYFANKKIPILENKLKEEAGNSLRELDKKKEQKQTTEVNHHDDNVMYNKIDSELQKVGVNILNIEGDDLDRLANFQRTKNNIPVSFNFNGMEIKTEAFLSLKEKNDGSLSLKIHAIVNDQERLRSISKSDNSVESIFVIFNGDEDKALNFIKRNNLLESFTLASNLYFEILDRNQFINNYLDVDVDRADAIEQGKKDYVEKFEKFEILEQEFCNVCASFNIVKNVELEPAQIRDLKQGKTIEVSNLIDDKGEKYGGFIHLNLTDAQIKELKIYPSKAINISKMAIVTPKHDYKVQVNHNNHGMRTEENKFSQEKVKSGDTISNDNKNIEAIGEISFLGFKGEVVEVIEYKDKESYFKAIKKEMDYNPDGFKYQTISKDPELKKGADDVVYGAYGVDNPHELEWYSSKVNDTTKNRITDIHIFSLKEGGMGLNCVIDGKKQPTEKMYREDVNSFSEKTDRYELVIKYYSAILNAKQTESKSLSGPAIKAEASERNVSKENLNRHQLNNNNNYKKGQRL